MLTVDDYGRIRRAHRDGMSIRQVARIFRHFRRKIRHVLAEPVPGRDSVLENQHLPVALGQPRASTGCAPWFAPSGASSIRGRRGYPAGDS